MHEENIISYLKEQHNELRKNVEESEKEQLRLNNIILKSMKKIDNERREGETRNP